MSRCRCGSPSGRTSRSSACCTASTISPSASRRSLLNRPDLLLLDEPTASLDPDTADWVRARLERYRDQRGATLLIASHNMAEVERLCERVIFMKQGKIEDDDTPAGLLARYGRDTLEEVFLDVARGRGTHEAAR
jgi:ABC-2 type transport system ATP-binding protein